MHIDKIADGLRADVERARAQADPDAEQAARKRLAALGIAEAAKARRVAAESSPDSEPEIRQRPPQGRQAPQRQNAAKRPSKG